MTVAEVDLRRDAAEALSALSEARRLTVFAAIATRPDAAVSISDLAAMVGLQLAEVGAACGKLLAVGLVQRNDAGLFVAEARTLACIARRLDDAQPVTRVLKDFPRLRGLFAHGKLVAFPSVLTPTYKELAQMLAGYLDLQGETPEAEVNELLRAVTDDPAKVRRMLVDTGWLARTPQTGLYRAAR